MGGFGLLLKPEKKNPARLAESHCVDSRGERRVDRVPEDT